MHIVFSEEASSETDSMALTEQDTREIILLTQLVRYTAHLCPRTVFFLALIMLRFKSPACDKIRIIHDDVRMDMLMIFVYGNDILILLLQ